MKAARSILPFILMIGSSIAVVFLNARLVDSRRTLGISQADPMVNAPPLINFTTVALGGFRGIAADMLWLRLTRLQQEGRYVEIIQLADWITKLEPRFSDVWAYHSWNLAYNISAMMPDPDVRWNWVQQGIQLLRDQGLVYNPGDALLLLELGWLFQNKIGASFDEAHLYYKEAWAREMMDALGSPKPDLTSIAADPARAQLFREKFKMDISRMQALERTYGPVDWFSPQAHAIYWAMQAREAARGVESVMADRMIYQSLADAVWQGGVEMPTGGSRMVMRPRFDLLPYAINAYTSAMTNTLAGGFTHTAYVNFLQQAAVFLFMYDQPGTDELIEKLKEADRSVPADIKIGDLVVGSFLSPEQQGDPEAVNNSLYWILQQAAVYEGDGDVHRARGMIKVARFVRDYAIRNAPAISGQIASIEEMQTVISNHP